MTVVRPVARVGILLPPVWTHVFLPAARLLAYAFADLGIGAELVEYDGRATHEINVVVGWHLFDRPLPAGARYSVFQLEPLSLPAWRERLEERRPLFERAAGIWDYSQANLPYLQGLPAHWLPLGYHPLLRDLAPAGGVPEHDVLFVGFVSPRRRAVLEALSNRCLVSMHPRWGRDLSSALASTKLVLNIHQYDVPTPLEQPRVAYVLNQGVFVLSETSVDNPYPWLAQAPYADLTTRTLHYLHNPSERRSHQEAALSSFSTTSMADRLGAALAALALNE